ncbi:MAG: acetyl-CoA C-acetyltransferase [Acidobacteriota bacterium]
MVVIASAVRTAIGSFGGMFRDLTAVDLAAVVAREAIHRAGVTAQQVDEVIFGNVLQAGVGMNPARQAAVRAGLPDSVPCQTVNKVCGSGLKAVVAAAQAIAAGDAHIVVAGGTESMSNAPYLLMGARWGYRLGEGQVLDSMVHEGLTDAMHQIHMGITAENLAERYKITRQAQDEFSAESQRRAVEAIGRGYFLNEIIPIETEQKKEKLVLGTDEYPRKDTTAEKLSALKPAFKPGGSVTAGNSSGLNDGAAALVILSEEKAKELRIAPMARIVSYAYTGVDPAIMGIGPAPAIRRALDRAGLSLDDIDLFELNEAFAAQSLAVLQELGLDTRRVNIHGGAIALGHPIGASGARILATLLYSLERRKARRGVAALCIGGGQGIAMVVEVP